MLFQSNSNNPHSVVPMLLCYYVLTPYPPSQSCTVFRRWVLILLELCQTYFFAKLCILDSLYCVPVSSMHFQITLDWVVFSRHLRAVSFSVLIWIFLFLQKLLSITYVQPMLVIISARNTQALQSRLMLTSCRVLSSCNPALVLRFVVESSVCHQCAHLYVPFFRYL